MVSKELLEELHKLNRADKLHIIRVLVDDLAVEEAAYFRAGATYEIWSPFDAPEAADTLMRMLEEDREEDG